MFFDFLVVFFNNMALKHLCILCGHHFTVTYPALETRSMPGPPPDSIETTFDTKTNKPNKQYNT